MSVAVPLGQRLRASVETLFASRCLLWTNVGLSFALSGLGDVLQQQVEARQEPGGEKKRQVGCYFLPVFWLLYDILIQAGLVEGAAHVRRVRRHVRPIVPLLVRLLLRLQRSGKSRD